MNEIDSILRLANELTAQQGAAFDLWTWLPSYKEAVKYHGEYASNHIPVVSDVLIEAALVMSCQDKSDWFNCPCGEDHKSVDSENS